jgi:hypothetical protein
MDVSFLAYVPNRYYAAASDGPNPPFFLFTGTTTGLPNKTISASTSVPVTANYKELKIKKGVSVTIAGTLYGKIDIEEGATVIFAPAGGVLNVEQMKITGKFAALTRIRFTACTSIRVRDRIEVDNYTLINSDGPRVTFYLGDTNNDDEQFLVNGISNSITANIYVRKGEIRVKGALNVMKGWFIGERVISEGISIAWTGNDCNAEAPVLLTRMNQNTVTTGGIEATPTTFDVQASPNPSTDAFAIRVRSSDSKSAVALRITDLSGRVVLSRPGITSNSTIYVGSELRAGVYFAEVIQGMERRVVRLLKL